MKIYIGMSVGSEWVQMAADSVLGEAFCINHNAETAVDYSRWKDDSLLFT